MMKVMTAYSTLTMSHKQGGIVATRSFLKCIALIKFLNFVKDSFIDAFIQ